MKRIRNIAVVILLCWLGLRVVGELCLRHPPPTFHCVGPYFGQQYNNTLITEAVFSLELPSKMSAEVYYEADQDYPIFVIRSSADKIQSKILLIPKRTNVDERVDAKWIGALKKGKVYPASDGHVISFGCNWEYGGKEAGYIYLNNDHSFKEMWIGY